MIKNLRQLGEHLEIFHEPGDALEVISKRIARTLFKHTECGIGFHVSGETVTVSGYCEGVDTDCQPHALTFPFSTKAFNKAVEDADQDGIALWNQTHGCDTCAERQGLTVGQDEVPVDLECPECKGQGQII